LSSLWLRIWLSFWGVVVATFVVAAVIDYGLAVRRTRSLDLLSPVVMADAGARALALGGDEGVRNWLLGEHNLYPELKIFIVGPDGRELTGHRPSEVNDAWLHSTRGRTFPAQVGEKAGGRQYEFVFVRDRSLSFDVWDILLAPWILATVVLTVSGLGAALLARSFARPVRRLEQVVGEVADGSLETRSGDRLTMRHDEIGVLARGIDQMTSRIAEMVAAKDAILRDVSHELRAPLTRLRAAAELARRQGDSAFERIDKEVDRLDALVAQILRYARLRATPEFEFSPVDFTALALEVVEDAELEAGQAEMNVDSAVEEGMIVVGDERLLRSALENVLRNAVRFSQSGGRIEVLASSEGEGVRFEVRDCGKGIDESELPQIFEPFHGDGSGAGLGLAIVSRIVELHGGTIEARNRTGGGLAVSIELTPAGEPQSFRRPLGP
jgi:two-component system, OmpR family, sensor kinase